MEATAASDAMTWMMQDFKSPLRMIQAQQARLKNHDVIKVGIVGNSGSSATDAREAGETDGGIKVGIIGNSGGSAADTSEAGERWYYSWHCWQ